MDDKPPNSEARFTEHGPESINRRRIPRFGVKLDVTLESAHNFYQGFAENLSSGGLFVSTHRLRPIGERVDVSLGLPDEKESIDCLSEVRWVREYNERSDVSPGMGLRFIDITSEASARIAQFLETREPLFYDDDE